MFSRFIASWLVVLVVAPFTAPFPTCDLVSLFGQDVVRPASVAHAASALSPGRRTSSRRLRADSDAIDVVSFDTAVPTTVQSQPRPAAPLPSSTVSSDAALPGASAASMLARGRLSALVLSSSYHGFSLPPADFTRSVASAIPERNSAGLSTVLRV